MRLALTVSRATDAPADRRLDGHVEELAGDELAQLGGHLAPVVVGLRAVHDRREGVDGLAGEEDVDLDEVVGLGPCRLVVEAGVALGPALQHVEEVEHDLGERQLVDELDPVGREVLHLRHAGPAVSGTGP